MKNYDLSLQRKRDWCVPACLQAILRYEGVEITQERIIKQLNELENGLVLANDEKIKSFMRRNGFNYRFYFCDETPFNEPDFLLNEMSKANNHGIVGVNTHAFLLIDFKDPLLKLLDPGNGKIVTRDICDLDLEMREKSNGGYGLVEKIK